MHKPWYPASARHAQQLHLPAQRSASCCQRLHRRAWRSAGTSRWTAAYSCDHLYLPRGNTQQQDQLLLHNACVWWVNIMDMATLLVWYSVHNCNARKVIERHLICISFFTMALPCKPGSHREPTFHCPSLCLGFSPCKSRKPCPAGGCLSVCWAPSRHSAALKTRKQSYYSSL